MALISEPPFENVDAAPDQWLNKDFFKVEKPKAIEVVFPVATNSWKLARETETGDWKLANTNAGESFDSTEGHGRCVTKSVQRAEFQWRAFAGR